MSDYDKHLSTGDGSTWSRAPVVGEENFDVSPSSDGITNGFMSRSKGHVNRAYHRSRPEQSTLNEKGELFLVWSHLK